MKTYKFIMLRTYETELEYQAESLEQAREMLDADYNKYDEELEQNNANEKFYLVDGNPKDVYPYYKLTGVTPIEMPTYILVPKINP
jgi:hypothetical protein